MRELISFSLGPNSNFTHTHFWNSQDEWVKQDPDNSNEILYYETSNSRTIIPRAVYFDFRENFGNFLTCFSKSGAGKEGEIDITRQWEGVVQVGKDDEIPKSQFQKQLEESDKEYYQYLDEQKKKVEEEKQQQEILSQFKKASSLGKSGNNHQDLFMKMMLGQGQGEQKQKEEQIDTSVPKLPKQEDEKTPDQHYNEFKFDEEVKFFTDFMQSKMHPSNQVLIPHANSNQENFSMFYNGSNVWEKEGELRENTEESIRLQMERCDNLQGFNIMVDSNSGYGSLAEIIINIVKDDAPKLPVMLFSVRNSQSLEITDQKNLSVLQDLIDLNTSFSLANYSKECDLMIPIDKIEMGKNMGQYLNKYNESLIYHQSSIHSLLLDSMLQQSYSKFNHCDLKDFIRDLLYGDHPALVTTQMQIPYLINENSRLVENLEKFNFKNSEDYISFNQSSKVEQQVRVNFLLKGFSGLLREKESPSIVQDYFQQHLYKNFQPQRGVVAQYLDQAHLLPIPFPRIFSEKKFNCNGQLKEDQDNQFVYNVPSLTRVNFDSGYLGETQGALTKLKQMKPSSRAQLLKDCQLENDEIREKVESLEGLVENFLAFEVNKESEEENDDEY